MKIHRPVIAAISGCLSGIFSEGIKADRAVDSALKSDSRFGSRDRRFIAESVYGVVRWWRLLSEAAGTTEPMLLTGAWLVMKEIPLPDWNEFSTLDPVIIGRKIVSLRDQLVFRESVPDWLNELAITELGEDSWQRQIHAMNEEAAVVLRVNRLKAEVEKVRGMLNLKGIETIADDRFPDALILKKRQNIRNLEIYNKGFFEIQDASSQLVAPFLEVAPGMTVVDACAGAGGKSLHIAALMQNRGSIISMDSEARKLSELERRSKRAGVKIITTREISIPAVNALREKADRLLLDVPCSGLGVLRRNPDAKWKLTKKFIEEIIKVQAEILRNYSSMLKPGGIVVYATCSILPRENNEQVAGFLSSEKNFELLQEKTISPESGFDGFYMARLRKKIP